MALTTICTAWCSYESAAWTRRSNWLMNEYNALERRAALLEVQGSQALVVHTSMFMQLLAAQHAGNEKLATFHAERFAPDVKKAYETWLAQKPFENRAADPHPFVPTLYEVRGTAEAAAARAAAVQQVTEARDAGNLSGQYLANTVLFAKTRRAPKVAREAGREPLAPPPGRVRFSSRFRGFRSFLAAPPANFLSSLRDVLRTGDPSPIGLTLMPFRSASEFRSRWRLLHAVSDFWQMLSSPKETLNNSR